MEKNKKEEWDPNKTNEYVFKAGSSIKKYGIREGASEQEVNEKDGSVFRPGKEKGADFQAYKSASGKAKTGSGKGKPSFLQLHHVPPGGTAEKEAEKTSRQPKEESQTFKAYSSNPAPLVDASEKASKTAKKVTRKAGSENTKKIAGAAGKSNAVTAAVKTAKDALKKLTEAARASSDSGDKKGHGFAYLAGLIGGLLIIGALPFLVISQALGLSGISFSDATESDINRLLQDGEEVITGDYIQGNGVFLWPLPEPYGPDCISSGFGYRSDPFSGMASYHNGIDIAAPANTEIYAVLDGTVVISADGWNGGCGNYTVIRHSGNLYTEYMHQNRRAVNVGDRVRKGDVIGYVGTTGSSTGNHLHIGVVVSDHGFDYTRRVDPSSYLGV